MLFLKNTSAPLSPGLYLVDIAAKPPGKTFGVYIAVDGDNPPKDLIDAIEGMGFKRTVSKPYVHSDGHKVLDLHYQKAGTDIFDGWKPEEKESNMNALSELFGKFGVTLHPRVMTLAEAFQ
jgi:hypothetical protein